MNSPSIGFKANHLAFIFHMYAGRCKGSELDPWLGRSPGGGHGNPLQYSCLENPYGQRSLAGYNPWGHKESDTTEPLSTAYQDCETLVTYLDTLKK